MLVLSTLSRGINRTKWYHVIHVAILVYQDDADVVYLLHFCYQWLMWLHNVVILLIVFRGISPFTELIGTMTHIFQKVYVVRMIALSRGEKWVEAASFKTQSNYFLTIIQQFIPIIKYIEKESFSSHQSLKLSISWLYLVSKILQVLCFSMFVFLMWICHAVINKLNQSVLTVECSLKTCIWLEIQVNHV